MTHITFFKLKYSFMFMSGRSTDFSKLFRGETNRLEHYCQQLSHDRGLIKPLISYTKPSFYPCKVLHLSHPLLKSALNCRWPPADCFVYYRTEVKRGTTAIVYDLNCLAARWTAHAKINSRGFLA